MVSKEFVTAGRAVFTLEVPVLFAGNHEGCKAHYTYKVTHKEASAKYGEAWFVALLTGPDNTEDYSYLGMLNAETGEVKLTAASAKSNINANAWSYGMLCRVLANVWAGTADKIEAAGFKLHHEGACGRCGRLLTVPASVESGIGPECARKMAMA